MLRLKTQTQAGGFPHPPMSLLNRDYRGISAARKAAERTDRKEVVLRSNPAVQGAGSCSAGTPVHRGCLRNTLAGVRIVAAVRDDHSAETAAAVAADSCHGQDDRWVETADTQHHDIVETVRFLYG